MIQRLKAIIMDQAAIKAHIVNVMPTLMKDMLVTDVLLRILEEKNVLFWETRETILAESVNTKRVSALMDVIVRDIRGKLQGLISALRETNQE